MGFQSDYSKSSSSVVIASPDEWLVGGGEMGKLIRSMDWAKTPLGPIESWPQSLRTTVSLCLASNFPIALAWGPKHVQIYNDGYWPICGGKHPHSMGQDFSECWAAPWPVIGEVFTRALGGETSYLENQRMFLDRNGYLEETFFTFSFSPICDETGGVGGLFHPVTETTSRMLSERRTRGLRDLAARAGKAQTVEQACMFAAQTLADYELDLPFVLFYLTDPLGKEARLTASTGLQTGTVASPTVVDLEAPQQHAWPLREVSRSGKAQHFNDLAKRFGPLSVGPYPESVKEAIALPIIPPGCMQAIGILVAGVSARLPLNESYRAFYDLVAAGVTTAVANARAHEEERKRSAALAEIDRAKTAFFSNVSHEFRTPLTLILGPLEDELAEQIDPIPQARRERLEAAHRNSLRLLKLVNTLLDFSRIEAGRVQASYEPTDLAAHTAELASIFRSAVEKAGLVLSIDCSALPEAVYIDREMWEKIVLNLLSNALKHTFNGGIAVKLSWCGDHVELAVADSGVGIPQAALPCLFERFHRVKGAKSRTHEGTGIGLALVQELVSLHGGTVRVESEENKGSTFTVTVRAGTGHLPSDRVSAKRDLTSTATRAAAYVEEALQWLPNVSTLSDQLPRSGEADVVSTHNETPAIPGVRRARILWADDNADMRDYVRRLLADRYDVIAVPDGLTALLKAQEEPPDLVLSDIMMPGLDGFGLLRELRNHARTRTIPVILLSARAGEESVVEGLNTGADDYLAKPFSARELLARVRTHLELARVRREWANELEQANNELEAFSHSVSHDLQEPLRMVASFTQLLAKRYKGRLDSDADEFIAYAVDGSIRMQRLIQDLLTYSRARANGKALSEISSENALKEALTNLRATIEESGAVVTHDSLPAITTDDTQLARVFQNLVGNAIKYRSAEVPHVHVSATKNGGQEWIFSVRDNGMGIDPQYFERIFILFQRLHGQKEFKGTGIGLTICKKILEGLGGKIWVESQPGTGSTFYFALPERGGK